MTAALHVLYLCPSRRAKRGEKGELAKEAVRWVASRTPMRSGLDVCLALNRGLDPIYLGAGAEAAAPALLPGEPCCEEEEADGDDEDDDVDDEDDGDPGDALPEVLAPEGWAAVWVNNDDDECGWAPE